MGHKLQRTVKGLELNIDCFYIHVNLVAVIDYKKLYSLNCLLNVDAKLKRRV